MESYSKQTRSKSLGALVLLTLIAVGFLLFGLVTITCGFVLNYHDDFETAAGGQALESIVEAQFDYTQYWLGFPFLITSILAICSAMFQNNRSLTTVTIIFFHLCIILSLFAMVLEGVDWVKWKDLDRLRRIYEDKDGYQCENAGTTCGCTHKATNATIAVSAIASCSNITSIAGLFGAIVASAIVGIFLSLAGIVVILKSLSLKPRNHYVEYNLRPNVTPVQYKSYRNAAYANGGPPRMAGQAGSVNQVPMY